MLYAMAMVQACEKPWKAMGAIARTLADGGSERLVRVRRFDVRDPTVEKVCDILQSLVDSDPKRVFEIDEDKADQIESAHDNGGSMAHIHAGPLCLMFFRLDLARSRRVFFAGVQSS